MRGRRFDREDVIPVLVILVAVAIFVYVAIKLIADEPIVGASSQVQGTTFDHSGCQYPFRATNPPDGCDNSDPACPELIKGALNCPSDVVQPVISSSVAPAPPEALKKSACEE